MKLQKYLVLLSLAVMLIPLPASADEQITITTYYPSPYGSYKELETEILHFRETVNGLINFNYPDTIYDRRLRITAGKSDTGDNDQGASIDLHGNNNSGRLDLVAGQNGNISFLSSPTGTSAMERMHITADGYVVIGTVANPAELQVTNGNIKIGKADRGIIFSSGAEKIIGTSAKDIDFQTNGTSRVTILNSSGILNTKAGINMAAGTQIYGYGNTYINGAGALYLQNSPVSVSNNLSVGGNLGVGGSQSISGNLVVGGGIYCGSVALCNLPAQVADLQGQIDDLNDRIARLEEDIALCCAPSPPHPPH